MFANQRNELLADGYTKIGGVAPQVDVAILDQVTSEMIKTWFSAPSQDPDYWHYHEGTTPVLYRIHNFETKFPDVLRIMNGPEIQGLVESIFREPAQMTACALIYKQPRLGGEVPWHRDPIDVPPSAVFNFSLFLDRSDHENGCLEFVRGSHLRPELIMDQNIQRSDATKVQSEPGDIVIHDVKVLHGSGFCSAAYQRRSVVMEFRPARYL